MKVDFKIWSFLVSFCRIYGNMILGRIVVKELLELELNKVENYVLVLNLLV